MKRIDFIRLGAGASVAALVGGVSGSGGAPVDELERWAIRHQASVTFRRGSRLLVVKKAGGEIGSALSELDGIAEGPLLCQGNQARGSVRGQAFVVELAVVS